MVSPTLRKPAIADSDSRRVLNAVMTSDGGVQSAREQRAGTVGRDVLVL